MSFTNLTSLLHPPGQKEERVHRPPWTWHSLDQAERGDLEQLVDNWVSTYNRTLATSVRETVPPCWRHHPGLAAELPVMIWHWFFVHRGQTAQVTSAAEFYARHLPAFRGRVESYLGEAAEDCRAGNHPEDFRRELDMLIDKWPDPVSDAEAVDVLAALHCGFGAA